VRIAVAGATGVVGAHVVRLAADAGHDVVPLSRATGTDVATGAGLADALVGADAVVDVLNVTTQQTDVAQRWFTRTTEHLSALARHLVTLSIVGIDGAASGYYAGKVAQEQALAAGPAPWTLLRATQFHEFPGQMAQRLGRGPFVVVPAMRTATVAAAEVAAELLRLAEGPPQGRVTDLAGPEDAELADLVRRELAAQRRRRLMLRVPLPGAEGRRMRHGLRPGPDARRVGPTFDAWLSSR
jgi:uncharacterized protein YbjT (DUF2867 family)